MSHLLLEEITSQSKYCFHFLVFLSQPKTFLVPKIFHPCVVMDHLFIPFLSHCTPIYAPGLFFTLCVYVQKMQGFVSIGIYHVKLCMNQFFAWQCNEHKMSPCRTLSKAYGSVAAQAMHGSEILLGRLITCCSTLIISSILHIYMSIHSWRIFCHVHVKNWSLHGITGRQTLYKRMNHKVLLLRG